MVAEAARQVAFFALCDSTEILGIFAQSPDRAPGDVAPDVRRASSFTAATHDTHANTAAAVGGLRCLALPIRVNVVYICLRFAGRGSSSRH